MLGGDPARVVGLGAGSGNGGTVSANNGYLLGWVDLLGAAGRPLGALTTLAAALLLREEGGDPGVVNEEYSAAKNAEKNEIQEDARGSGQRLEIVRWMGAGSCIHLRVKDAGGRLDNGDGLVVRGDSEGIGLLVLDHSDELQADVLGVHLGREAVRQRLLLTAGDFQPVALAGEVAQDLRLLARIFDQGTTDDLDGDGLGFLVGDGQASLGRVAVD